MTLVISFIIDVGVFELCQWVIYRQPNHVPLAHIAHAVIHKAITAAKRHMVSVSRKHI